jgi:hypothetical protein
MPERPVHAVLGVGPMTDAEIRRDMQQHLGAHPGSSFSNWLIEIQKRIPTSMKEGIRDNQGREAFRARCERIWKGSTSPA